MAIKLGALRRLIASIQKLDQDKMLKNVLSNTGLQQDILELNFEDQLYERGVTADGKSLGNYTPRSVELKLSGTGDHRVDHITLKDKGHFYDSRRFINEKQDFKIYADTLKPNQDLMTFGKILGLDEKSKSDVRGWIKAPFIKEVRKGIKWKK